MRLFVALAIPDDVKARLGAAIAPLKETSSGLRWTRQEGWHVTLAFLGDVDDDAVEQAREAVQRGVEQAATGPIELSLAAAGHFGRRVLWYGLADQPEGATARLGRSIQREIAAAGLPCDDKAVHAHATLARPKGRGRLPGAVVEDVPDVSGAWTAEEVVLYRSHLGRGGARYEALAKVPLA